MEKLCEVESPVVAASILSRLQEASIRATVTHSPSPQFRSWKHVQPTIVWIARGEDLPRAREIADAVRQAPLETDRCPGCGYDLAGHDDAGICPECGEGILPPVDDVVCPECGEPGPPDFEACWNCGDSNPVAVDSISVARNPSSSSLLPGLWRWILLAGMVFFGVGIIGSGLRSCL